MSTRSEALQRAQYKYRQNNRSKMKQILDNFYERNPLYKQKYREQYYNDNRDKFLDYQMKYTQIKKNNNSKNYLYNIVKNLEDDNNI